MSFVSDAFIALAQEARVPGGTGLTGLQLIEGLINRLNTGMEGEGSQLFSAYVLLGLRRNMPAIAKDLGLEVAFETQAKLVLGGLFKASKDERARFLENIKDSQKAALEDALAEPDTAADASHDLQGGPA